MVCVDCKAQGVLIGMIGIAGVERWRGRRRRMYFEEEAK
jgi:hypothetical protein